MGVLTLQQAISELALASFSKRVDFHGNQNHFHVKRFARGLVLKQKHKVTLKWPIACCI